MLETLDDCEGYREASRKITQSKWQAFHKDKMEKRSLKKTALNESK